MADEVILCKDSSLQAGEPLPGTAPHVNVWLLLEYWNTWSRDAFEDSDLSSVIKDWLNTQLASIPNSRLVFIKQGPKSPAEGFQFYVAVSKETSPSLHKIHLDSYEDLLVLDLQGIMTNELAYKYTVSEEKLFLVCGNGRRDRCCAQAGPPLYEAMREVAGANVWQSTHLGGHRFAPTGVTLPYGAYYGRMTADKVPQFVADTQADRLTLDHLRGRSCFTPFEQAAEHFIRRELGLPHIHDLLRMASTRVGEDAWAVQFRKMDDNTMYRIRVEKQDLEQPVYKSSGDAEPQIVYQYVADYLRG